MLEVVILVWGTNGDTYAMAFLLVEKWKEALHARSAYVLFSVLRVKRGPMTDRPANAQDTLCESSNSPL